MADISVTAALVGLPDAVHMSQFSLSQAAWLSENAALPLFELTKSCVTASWNSQLVVHSYPIGQHPMSKGQR